MFSRHGPPLTITDVDSTLRELVEALKQQQPNEPDADADRVDQGLWEAWQVTSPDRPTGEQGRDVPRQIPRLESLNSIWIVCANWGASRRSATVSPFATGQPCVTKCWSRNSPQHIFIAGCKKHFSLAAKSLVKLTPREPLPLGDSICAKANSYASCVHRSSASPV